MVSSGPGGLLRGHRRRMGLSQAELAGRAGLSVRALRDLENGRVTRPQVATVRRLAAALSLSGEEHAALVAALGSGSGAPWVRIDVLGPVVVRHGEDPVAVAPKLRDLLGLLAVQPRRAASPGEIVDVLWGEFPPRTHPRLLHVYIGLLRELVEPARPRGQPAGIVRRVGAGYQLDIDAEQLDLARFDDLVTRAGRAGSAAERRELLRAALSCWRGPLLADAGDRLGRHPAAVAVNGRRIAAALSYADVALADGDHGEVVEQLRLLVRDEPMHEGLTARLMLALAGRGEQAAALRMFDTIRHRLDDQLGITPGAELRDAHLRVLRQETAGWRGHPRPAHLPPDVAAFSGREEQLGLLDTLLGGSPAVVAITGTAGVGKTALAAHWGHRVRDHFPGGQLYVDLRGYSPVPPAVQPLEALTQFLHALGVPARQVPSELADAVGLYRSLVADRRMLVVLDNALDADQVRPLLPGGAHCLVLVTSRDTLTGLVARDGAHPVGVDVFTREESRTLLVRLLGAARVRAEPGAAEELARLCARLPLALRIAAAKLLAGPADAIADYTARLAGDRLPALEIHGDRHSAVRSAFQLSYAALSPPAARLFRLMGRLPGLDVTLDAAAALAGNPAEETRPLVAELVAAHLVTEHAPGRYTFHDLLRLYAAELSEACGREGPAALDRLFAHYLGHADAAAAVLYPEILRLPAADVAPAVRLDHRQASAWLDAERHNLLRAVRHAAAHGPRPVSWLLADALRGYYDLRMHTVDCQTAAEAALTAAQAEHEPAAQASAHLSLANLDWRGGRYPAAIDRYREALVLARRAGWGAGQAAARGNLGGVHAEQGRLREAAEHYTEALALLRETGNRGGQAMALGNLGHIHGQLGHLTRAAEHHAEALALFREIGARAAEATELANLGETYHRLGRLTEAVEHLDQALALHREVGDRANEVDTTRVTAAVHRDAGRPSEALDLARSALALAREIKENRCEADVLNVLAGVHAHLEQHEQAADHHWRALDLARATGAGYPHAEALIGLTRAYTRLAKGRQATTTGRRALAVTRKAGFSLLEGKALIALAAAHLGQGEADLAARQARKTLKLADILEKLAGTNAVTPLRQEAEEILTSNVD